MAAVLGAFPGADRTLDEALRADSPGCDEPVAKTVETTAVPAL